MKNMHARLRTISLALLPILLALSLCCSSRTVRAEDPPSNVGPVLKLFKSGRLPPERQGTVVEMICNRGNEHDLRVVFDQLLQPQGFTPELQTKAIGWLADAAATRKVTPTGDLSGIVQTDFGKERPVRLAAIRAATAWKLSAASDALQSLATSPDASVELQRAAIEGLVAISGEDSQKTLLKLAANGQPMPVRMLAIAGLVGLDLKVASEQAATALSEASATDKPDAMLIAFFDRKEGSDALAAASKKRNSASTLPRWRCAICTRSAAVTRAYLRC